MSDDKLIDLLVKRGLFYSRKQAIDMLVSYALRDLIQTEFFKKKLELIGSINAKLEFRKSVRRAAK